MNNPPTILFFANGNTAVFKDGEQVAELQQSWFMLFIDRLESQGFNVDDPALVIGMPNGRRARLFKTSEGRRNWLFDGEVEVG